MTIDAKNGNAEAQFLLGFLYVTGEGVPQDYAKAAIWFRKAAKQGFAKAQFNLGVLYALGLGVPKGYAQAAKWYRKAANQGLALAQYYLGEIYEQGQGVPLDYVGAHALFSLAAQTVPAANATRATLEKRMTPAEIATAQALSIEMAKPGNLAKALDA